MAEQDVVADREPISGAVPVAMGAGAVARIPVTGTRGLAIGLNPRGWKPRNGSTSSLFVQDLTGKRHLRLDFGFNKNSQVVSGWTAADGGCEVVGAGGAHVGTAVAPGVGTAVGGFIGCTVGAFSGYVSAERAAGYLFDWAATAVFGKITGESVLPAPPYGGEGGSFGAGGTFGGGGASGTW